MLKSTLYSIAAASLSTASALAHEGHNKEMSLHHIEGVIVIALFAVAAFALLKWRAKHSRSSND